MPSIRTVCFSPETHTLCTPWILYAIYVLCATYVLYAVYVLYAIYVNLAPYAVRVLYYAIAPELIITVCTQQTYCTHCMLYSPGTYTLCTQ